MYTIASDEKAVGVMVYTQNQLVRGELVTKQQNRVSVWLRTDGAPEYLHILKPQVVHLAGSSVKILNYPEMYFPTSLVIAFHMTPPAKDPMDFDESEKNRMMQPISLLVGSFVFNGIIRISTQVDLGTSISAGRAVWMSIYEVKITNPYLPQMGEIQVPLLLVRPAHVGFALSG